MDYWLSDRAQVEVSAQVKDILCSLYIGDWILMVVAMIFSLGFMSRWVHFTPEYHVVQYLTGTGWTPGWVNVRRWGRLPT